VERILENQKVSGKEAQTSKKVIVCWFGLNIGSVFPEVNPLLSGSVIEV